MHKDMRMGRGNAGVVLLTVLVFIFIATLASSSLVVMYTTQLQREREEELLFVGSQYRKAMLSYYNLVPPGRSRSLPKSLDALLNDDRLPTPVHHIRRLYPDPFTGRVDWDLLVDQRGIFGIRSRSLETPVKIKGFPPGLEVFENKAHYSEWVFAIVPIADRAAN